LPPVRLPESTIPFAQKTNEDAEPFDMTLYHTEWCPECAVVRDKLSSLDLEYESVIVPDLRPFRKQVLEVSGQSYVPVLVDGETVLTETGDILEHLDSHAPNA